MRFSLAGTVEAPSTPLAVNLARAQYGPGVLVSEVLHPIGGQHFFEVFLMEPDQSGFCRVGHVQASDREQAERAAIQWYGPEAIILPPKE
jgi:1,2-phenylacetyl-CoA epoxidase PaaB subunit